MPHGISNESWWIIIGFLVVIEVLLLRLCFVCGKLRGHHIGWDSCSKTKISADLDALRDD
jgi:hypothetical protein